MDILKFLPRNLIGGCHGEYIGGELWGALALRGSRRHKRLSERKGQKENKEIGARKQ